MDLEIAGDSGIGRRSRGRRRWARGDGFAIGDRIAYIDTSYGAYRQERLLSAGLALRLPDDVSDEAAGSLTIKGFTACMLLRKVYAVGPVTHC